MTRLLTAFLLLLLPGLAACRKPEPTVPQAIIVRLERLAASAPPSVQQVQPYEEGLVFHSYAVKKVIAGQLDAPRIQLAHWAVVGSEVQPVDATPGAILETEILPLKKVPGAEDLYQANDLDDYDSPQFVEVPPATRPVASGFRHQYGGAISKQMRLYWELRPQLRLIALGNSRTGTGVLTSRFFPEVNAQTPVALNLAPPGSNMELQALLAKEYVLPLPRLEWVVWGVCPRYFNTKRRESDRLSLFTESHGRRYDLAHADELWPVLTSNPPLSLEDIQEICPAGTDPYGATPRPDGHSPDVSTPELRRAFVEDFFTLVRFGWDQAQWDLFVDAVTALDQKGVKVLLFTPPTHPLAREGKACDPDGLAPEHDARVIEKIRALDQRLPNVWFEDIHQAGHHDFPPEDFSDPGHLDHSGALRLTDRLVARLQTLPGADGGSRQ